MKIRIELDAQIEENEILIRCREMDDAVKRIQKYAMEVSHKSAALVYYQANQEYYLPNEAIIFFETDANTVYAHTADDVYRIRQRLYELEDILPPDFVRISKSTIVNVAHILSIARNLTASSPVQFHKSHKQVYVSRYYYKTLKQRLDERRTK